MGDKAGADAGVPAVASGDKPADAPQPESGAGGAQDPAPESAAKVADAPQPDAATSVTDAPQPDTATKVADAPQPETAANAAPEPVSPAQENQSSVQSAGPTEPSKTQEEPAKAKSDETEAVPKGEKSTEAPTDTGATKVTKEDAQPKDAPVPAESSATAETAKTDPVAQPEASLPTNQTDTKVSDTESKSDTAGAEKSAPEDSAGEKPAPVAVEAEKPTDTVVHEAAAAPESSVPVDGTAQAIDEKPVAVADESKPEEPKADQAPETIVKAPDQAAAKGEGMEAIVEKPADNQAQEPMSEKPAGNQETPMVSEKAAGKSDQAPSTTSASPTATAVKEPQVPTPTNVSSAPSPSQSTPQDSASQPGVKPIPPPASLNQKPAPAGHTPGFLQNAPSALKGSATPWANLPKPEAPQKAGPVQMVGTHEDTTDALAESSEEYRKQFSERKKFFKQQMEQQDTLPIKVAPPPATYKQQAPAAQPEPIVPVVLSQPKVPEALRLPINTEQDASPGTGVLRSTGSQYSPAAMAAAEKEAQASVVERPAPSPIQPKQPSFGPPLGFPSGQTTPFTTFSPADLTSPLIPPTPYHTPATETPPMWNPPQGPIATPSQSGAQVSPGIGYPLPSFEVPRKINQWAPGASALDQTSVPVPFGQQRPPAALPPFAQQSPTVRTPSPTFNLQQQQPQQQKPQLALAHNQFSSPQAGVGGYTPPGYAPQPAGTAPYASQPLGAGLTSHAPLQDLTDFMGMDTMHKKKTFVDSSFYSEKNELYPTFEEQVKLCRDISSSLTSDDNKQSLGARMFTRRQVKSKKWIADAAHHGVNGDKWESGDESDVENEPPKPAGPPPMKYYMSPKGVDDAQSLMLKHPEAKIFDSISPISLAAVSQGLENSAGRGVDLFQKRKQKSEEWVVDETNVKKVAPMPVADNAPNTLQSILNSPSVLYVKSPWEAALESPIGSCENAFQSARLGDRANPNSVLTSRTPSPHVGAPVFQKTASPIPPPTDSFSRLPRGWGAASGTPAPVFEPAPFLHPPSPSPKPTPPVFKPATPEPMPAFRPQFNQPPPTPAPVHSVYRAAPPVAADYPPMNDNVALDADIPNYQPAPQSVARRYSQPAVELANVNFYNSPPPPQQPPWLSQPSQDFYRPSAGGDRHVTWDPKVKNVDTWAPQSTDEFRRMYNAKHQMWERPPEPVSHRTSHSRSRSQPPAPYAPGQQRGYQPSYNTYAAQPARKWGDNMANWRPSPQAVPGMAPSFRPQSPVSPRPASGSWGADMNSWKPRFAAVQQQPAFNRPQPKPASPSRPGSWGPDMHSWTPRPQAPSPQPTYRPQQQQLPGSWGPDMNNWTPRQQAPRFSAQQQQQTQSPPWGSGGQPSQPSFAPASSGRYGAQPQQYGAQPQQYGAQPQQYGAQPQQYAAQPQQYGTLPRASPGASQWGGNRGGLLVSDM